VSTIGGLFIKRLQPKANGTVELISDNPAYPPERIESSDVRILGKVVGAFTKVA
jgi:phage repressor protein C with HTH and peptisase S24 domain